MRNSTHKSKRPLFLGMLQFEVGSSSWYDPGMYNTYSTTNTIIYQVYVRTYVRLSESMHMAPDGL